MTRRIHLKNADWAVVWDDVNQRHAYRNNCDIVFAGNTIIHAGASWQGEADETIDARGRLIMPGLVNIHCHSRSGPIGKGIMEELGTPTFWMSGLYDANTRNGHEVEYIWDLAAGRRHFEAAIRVIEGANAHRSGRLSGMLAPDTLDTTDEVLLYDTLALAGEKRWPVTIHCAESMVEFHEFTRRTGKTPVAYAKSKGVLRPGTILGHCIYLDTHSWPHWHTREDLRSIAESGAAVAHCPTAFMRGGVTMESLPDYVDAGVIMGIGTDTFPHNMLEEMRMALILARVACEDMTRVPTGGIFHLATVGGAKALGRDDIGRIAAGAKADLVSIDLNDPSMRPLRDPLKSLIHCAADRPVRDVWIDGRQVVTSGRIPQIDVDSAATIVEAAQRAAEKAVPEVDWAKRQARELAPLSLATIT